MSEYLERISAAFQMGYVAVTDRLDWQHKHWPEHHLLSQDESRKILLILAATADN